jgi:hypothetical protein
MAGLANSVWIAAVAAAAAAVGGHAGHTSARDCGDAAATR